MSGSPDPTAAAEVLLMLIRWQPSQEPVADLPSPMAEQFLLDGRLADGETALLLALDANPTDDELRFGLGAIQFFRAVDNFGKGLYEYGVISANTRTPFLRLPVPHNPAPSAISYQAFGLMLDIFATDLSRAEATLALISDDNVKLRLRLAKITFDFTGTGKNPTTLLDILAKLNGGRFPFEIANPEFRIHFDRGDVAWLRAYCHLLCAMVDGYRAVDMEVEWNLQCLRFRAYFNYSKARSVSLTPLGSTDCAVSSLVTEDDRDGVPACDELTGLVRPTFSL